MTNSVSSAYNSVETESLANWNEITNLARHEILVREIYMRDPVKDSYFGFDVIAVYGYFSTDTEDHLVYFWHPDQKQVSPRNGGITKNIIQFLKLGDNISNIMGKEPTFKTVCSLLDSPFELDGDEYSAEQLELHWKSFGELKFACVYSKKLLDEIDGGVNRIDDRNKDNCLCFHCDYFSFRTPIWSAVPLRYLFERADKSLTGLTKIHLEPKMFWPMAEHLPNTFLWPWQNCIKNSGDKLVYNGIPTCSLVFDLRKSTLAMQAVKDIGDFSPFIKEIVDNATEIVFEYGGYFDKETGDGIVAHFAEIPELGGTGSHKTAPIRAFNAAVSITRSTNEICEAFQPKLNEWINFLGGSVGLHFGDAVWTVADNSVQAIGDSVVYAARLCAEAEVNNVFITNSFFQCLSGLIRPEIIAKFDRREYVGKENGDKSQKSGFTVDVKNILSQFPS